MDRKTCVFVAATLGLFVTLCGQSQPITGSIHGLTRNSTGEMIPKTEITVRHWESEFLHTCKFSLSGIHPGRDIEKQKAIIRGLQNNADQGQNACMHNIGTQPRAQIALQEIQKELHQDEIILEYILQEPSSMCVAIGRKTIQRISLASRHVIEEEIAAYTEEIMQGRHGSQTARRLYTLLLAPISNLDRKRRITIIPGGLLHLLPFEALVTHSGDYVINTHVINYSPSAAAALSDRMVSRKPDRRCRFLAVGDPRSPFPKGMKSAAFTSLPKPGRLPGARMEVLSIAHLLENSSKIVTLLGEDASEAAVKALSLADFNVLHFSVHGASDTNQPTGSALFLGSFADEAEDGILQAWEVSRMQLKADLVVLSACNTAMGRSLRQDGISDLVHAFLLAGARTVVGSIWPAEDRSTADLMIRFYAYLTLGIDKGSALRQAKLDFIAKYRDAALPVLWAGMLMVGDSSDSIPSDHQ